MLYHTVKNKNNKNKCFYPSLQTASQFIVLTSSLKQVKQKKSNSQAPLHLSALDLFYANLWVQHHLPLLHLAWTPPPPRPQHTHTQHPFWLLLLCPLIMMMALYSHHQNNNVKEVGTPLCEASFVFRNLLFHE